MKNAEEFIKALASDKELAEKANAVLSQCKTEEETIKAVVDFAKTQGYEFDPEEFTKAKAKIREMSDEDLDKVAGGILELPERDPELYPKPAKTVENIISAGH